MRVFNVLRDSELLYMGPRDFIDSGNHNETESRFQSEYFLLSQQPWNSLWFSELRFIAEAVLHIPSVNFFLSSESDREFYVEYTFESLDYRWKGALTDNLWRSKYYPRDKYCTMHDRSFALKTVGDALLLRALVDINFVGNNAWKRDGINLPWYSNAEYGKASKLCIESANNKTLARLYDLLDLKQLVPENSWIKQQHTTFDEHLKADILEHCLALILSDEEADQGATPLFKDMIACCILHVLRWLAIQQLVH